MMRTFFDRLVDSVVRGAEVVEITETGKSGYSLTKYWDGLDAYLIEYDNGKAMTIRRTDQTRLMTRADKRPPWMEV